MNASQIWEELEAEGAERGEFRRRIHPEAVADLYLVVRKPANMRSLLIDVDLGGSDLGDLPRGGGIELVWTPRAVGGEALQLVLSQSNFADLFNALVTDVAAAAALGTDTHDVAARVTARVRRWQTFLREAPAGLSPERQRGLYGELYCLGRVLLKALTPEAAVGSWTGPLRALQDFSIGESALEVKTTMANKHQAVRIANERQLDTTPLRHLALFHLSVDAREGAGETLPEMVSDVRARLPGGTARDTLEERLFAGGYLDLHAPLYRAGYTVREANIFEVTANFPRITEGDCPLGVADVRYSISLSALHPFLVDAARLKSLLEEA